MLTDLAMVIIGDTNQMLQRYGLQAIAWDIDGTLIDSEWLHDEALYCACRKFGIGTEIVSSQLRGPDLHKIWAMLTMMEASPGTKTAWIEEVEAQYLARIGEISSPEMARATVCHLADLGVRQVCVSNSTRSIVDANIEFLGIGRWLDGIVSVDDVLSGKPSPDPYLLACSLLLEDPGNVLAVEDSATGAASARNAGLKVAVIAEHFEALESDFVIRRIDEVSRLFAPRGDA